jgi:hypothetical protein
MPFLQFFVPKLTKYFIFLIKKMSSDEMTREKFEIIVILEGTVESTGQSGLMITIKNRLLIEI